MLFALEVILFYKILTYVYYYFLFCRSAPRSLRLMQVGLHAGNRKLLNDYLTATLHISFKDFFILLVLFLILAAMHTYIPLMACLSTNWQYLCQGVASIRPRIMMTCASFVQMAGILFFVMDALGPSTEVYLKFFFSFCLTQNYYFWLNQDLIYS